MASPSTLTWTPSQQTSLRQALRSCLTHAPINGLESSLGHDFVHSLLLGASIESTLSPRVDIDEWHFKTIGPVLERPYTNPLADSIMMCSVDGKFHRPTVPNNGELVALLVESEDELRRWEFIVYDGIRTVSWEGTRDSTHLEQQLVTILSQLGCRGIRAALGQRRTVGTCEVILPPSREAMLRSFNVICSWEDGGRIAEKNGTEESELERLTIQIGLVRTEIKAAAGADPKEEDVLLEAVERMGVLTKRKRELQRPSVTLSVGARALMKHAHRGSEGFWQLSTSLGSETKRARGMSAFSGGDRAKNAAAEEIVARILDDGVWGNLHGLPQGLLTYELRVREGYGARWTLGADGGGVKFRGLLEPQMKDGHAKQWKH